MFTLSDKGNSIIASNGKIRLNVYAVNAVFENENGTNLLIGSHWIVVKESPGEIFNKANKSD
jgi:hypothetical protein